VILDTYAVSCPWAVVIKAEHTGIAFRAVVSPRRPILLALAAMSVLDVLPNEPVKAPIYGRDIDSLWFLFVSRS
jgi:hypothetical protein